MPDSSYQNPDVENNNPLQQPSVEKVDTTPLPKKLSFTLPTDPKLKLVYILFGIVIVLFIISIPATIIRNTANSISTKKIATPTSNILPTPTEVIDISKIPPELNQKFIQADKETQINVNFMPPQIDTEIGR